MRIWRRGYSSYCLPARIWPCVPMLSNWVACWLWCDKIRRFSFVFFYERRYFPKPRIQVYIRFFRKIFEHKMRFLFRELISPYSSVGRASRCRFRDLREKNSVFPSCGEMHEKRDGRVVCSNQTEGIYFFLSFFPPRSNVVKGIHQNRRTLDAFLDLKPRDSFWDNFLPPWKAESFLKVEKRALRKITLLLCWTL